MRHEHDVADILQYAVQNIRVIHSRLAGSVQKEREHHFTRMSISTPSDPKDCLRVDMTVEEQFRRKMHKRFPSSVYVLGEESLPEDLAAHHKNRICILVDMVDGTDLFELGIPMWCSAAVLFDPTEPKILAAIVGLASGEIYVATGNDVPPYVCREPSEDLDEAISSRSRLNGPSECCSLHDATVAFYGQKAKGFLSAAESKPFRDALARLARVKNAQFRLHTLAGNPMMVMLADRERDPSSHVLGGGIDSVFEIRGQKLHDLVPGLFIAQKAGAYACTLDGAEITPALLAQNLQTPTMRMKYILASTRELAEELLDIFGAPRAPKKTRKLRSKPLPSTVKSPTLWETPANAD